MDTSDLHVAGIIAAIAVVVGLVVERLLSKTISSYGKRHHVPDPHIRLMRLIVRWILVIVVVVVVLSVFGIAIANLWITMSAVVLGALIAFFAGWSLLANVLATLLILI